MQGRLESFMKCLALRWNSHKITELYDTKKSDIETKLAAVNTARDKLETAVNKSGNNKKEIESCKTALTNANNDLASEAAAVAFGLKDVKTIKNRINEIIKKKDPKTSPDKYTDTQKDEALEQILGLAGFSIFYDGTHREYGKALESAADSDITASAGKKVSIHAGSDIVITADSSITLQVGNSAISMDGNGISLATAYYKNKFSPWDGRIALNPITGVSVSGFQFQANTLMAAGLSDSFGGSLGTKTGLMSLTAPQIKLSNMNGWSCAKVLSALGSRLLNDISDTICQGQDTEDAEMASAIISNLCSCANKALSITAAAKAANKAYGGAVHSGASGARAKADLAISYISLAMDVLDVLESFVVCDIVKNCDKDAGFITRNSKNGYVCGHDIYLIVTSSVRTASLMTNALLLMADNLMSPHISSLELNASGTTQTAESIECYTASGATRCSPLSALDHTVIEIAPSDSVFDDAMSLVTVAARTAATELSNAALNTADSMGQLATVTSLDRHDVTGSEEILVSESRTVLHEESAAGTRTEGTGDADEVLGSSGEIAASETKGRASSANADALKSGAAGVKDSAGGLATDVTGEEID